MPGMTHEQMTVATLAMVECIAACALLSFAQTPTEVAGCCIAALCGFVAFALAIGD